MRLSRRVSVIEGGLMRRFIFILLLLAMGICAFYMLEQINMTSYALAVSRLSSSYFIEVYRNGDSRSLNEAKYIIDEVGSIKSGFDGFLLFGKTTLVDDSVLVADIEEAIRKAGGNLVEKVQLFDIYKGEQIPADKKSIAYAIAYRDENKTLNEKDITKVHDKILKALEHKLGAVLR